MSRISPTRITSGSCRSTRRNASANPRVSTPTSRWLIIAFLSVWITSMGSSMVMMLQLRVRLIRSISADSVVVLPAPVGPVTRINPRGSEANLSRATGIPKSANVWPGSLSTLMATAVRPLCR